MPNGAFEIVVMVAITWVCIHYTNIRSYCIVASNIIALVGGILIFSIPFSNKAGLLIGYYLVSTLECVSTATKVRSFSHGLPATQSHFQSSAPILQDIPRRSLRTFSLLPASAPPSKLKSSTQKQTVDRVKHYCASILLVHTKASLP